MWWQRSSTTTPFAFTTSTSSRTPRVLRVQLYEQQGIHETARGRGHPERCDGDKTGLQLTSLHDAAALGEVGVVDEDETDRPDQEMADEPSFRRFKEVPQQHRGLPLSQPPDAALTDS